MLRIANHTAHLALFTALLGLAPACGDPIIESGSSDGSESESGDGDTDTDPSGSESESDSDSGDGDGDDPATDTDPSDSGDGDGDSGDGDGDPTESGDGDGDPTDTDDPTDTGDGDGDETGDGDGDPQPDTCGDSILDEFEECDDGNMDSQDGCLSDCTVPRSCLQVIEVDPNAPDGPYLLTPAGGVDFWETQCDMSTDGGGWTQIEVQDTCTVLSSDIVAVDDADNFDVNGECMPATRDGLQGHTYYWDIDFPPQFSAFYMQGYAAEANTGGFGNATSEINGSEFQQSSWDDANGSDNGDIAFGDPVNPPVTSFGAAGTDQACYDCSFDFPMENTIFELVGPSNELRIGWGEEGIELEGWRPWVSGSIYVR